jgi:hypothetical protein
MKSLYHCPLVVFLFCLSAPLSSAEEAAPQPAKETGGDLSSQLQGYWVTDFESEATKDFLTAHCADEEKEKEVARTAYEIKEGEMTVYQKGEASVVKIGIKSQDVGKRIIEADFLSENEDPVAMNLLVEGNRLTLQEKNDEGKNISIGLKRIDKQEFEKRVPEALRNGKQDPDPPEKPVESEDGYPTATPVPDKPGFVYSPYNKKVVDIREVPFGTLVADPHFDPSGKKYFRAP